MSRRNTTLPDTKAALLEAAERLIAEKGLGAVSVKMITEAAGARNPSAVYYHFGNIETLITTVFAQRNRVIEEDRLVRLAAIEETDPERRLRALLEAAIGPYLESCRDEGGRRYVSFCLQFIADPRFDHRAIVEKAMADSIAILWTALSECMVHVPRENIGARLRQTFQIALVQAADYARAVAAGEAPPVEVATREAVCCLAAFLSAHQPES